MGSILIALADFSSDEGADDVHAGCTCDRSVDEKLAAAPFIDEHGEPEDCHYCLEDTENTGHEVDGVVAVDTHSSEDGGGVVVLMSVSIKSCKKGRSETHNSIDTREVLQDEEHVSKEEAPQDLSVGECELDGLEESFGDLIVCGLHHLDFFDDVLIGGFEVTDPAEVLDGLLTATLAEQPAWRLSEHNTSNQYHTGRDELNSERNQELVSSSKGRRLGNTKDNPEAYEATGLPSKFVKTDKSTTDGGRSDLGKVNWNLYRAMLAIYDTLIDHNQDLGGTLM